MRSTSTETGAPSDDRSVEETGSTPVFASEVVEIATAGPMRAPAETSPGISPEEIWPANGVDSWRSSLLLTSWPPDPADRFSFLVRYTGAHDLLHTFESDLVLKVLERRTLALLKEYSPTTDHLVQEVERSGKPRYVAMVTAPLGASSYLEDAPHTSPSPVDAYPYNLDECSTSTFLASATEGEWSDRRAHHLGLGADDLTPKTLEITSWLCGTTFEGQSPQSCLPAWSTEIEAMCLRFFSPSKICIFVDAYWNIWSPHWPVLHRPTFDPLSTPIPLLTAMIMVGACHSPNTADRADAKFWYDLTESMVYNHLDSSFAITSNSCDWASNESQRRHTIQAIQAALLVCIFQGWDGSQSARQRIRIRRLNEVTAVRSSHHFVDASSLIAPRPVGSTGFRGLDIARSIMSQDLLLTGKNSSETKRRFGKTLH